MRILLSFLRPHRRVLALGLVLIVFAARTPAATGEAAPASGALASAAWSPEAVAAAQAEGRPLRLLLSSQLFAMDAEVEGGVDDGSFRRGREQSAVWDRGRRGEGI